MEKKLKKYIKLVVSIMLIISFIVPSNAALSASDGSAFVTKAEFDSALQDFNSRLTTFEAGINSKIDSQVTSYLDRNGIWNGKVQVINSTHKKVEVSAVKPTSWNSSGVSELANVDLVKEITKSGLLLVKGKYYCTKSGGAGYNFGFWFDKNDASTNAIVAGIALTKMYYNGKPGISQQYYSSYIRGESGDGRWNTSWTACSAMVAIGESEISFNDLFFVSSGDVLCFKLEESWWVRTGCSDGGPYENKLIFEFNDIVVY